MKLPPIFGDLLDLIYPRLCVICKSEMVTGMDGVCIHCLRQLPRTSFHLHADNSVSRIFTGRAVISRATAFLYFEKNGLTQKLLHQLKYRDNTAIGELLGVIAGGELKKDGFMDEVDYLIPIPLHPQKLALRGYNQSEVIAKGLSASTRIPVLSDVVERRVHTNSQTRKARYQRWENVQDIFKIKEGRSLVNRHVLIVDDVTTTGSTIESCASKLLQIKNLKVSVFCMAFAR